METKTISIVGFLISPFVLLPCCYAQHSPQDYLNAHHTARAKVHISPLVWDANLATDAQSFLDSTVLLWCSVATFIDMSTLGINVKVGVSLTGVAAVDSWLSEEVNPNFIANSRLEGTCSVHAQVLWSGTKSVGCSRMQCLDDDSLVAVACKYDPPCYTSGGRAY